MFETEALWVASREEAGAGRGANVGANIAVGTANALGGEFVEDGRFDLEGAVAAEVTISHVIGKDHENVGLLGAQGQE